MWDLNFETWISHRGFTVAFGLGHPLVIINDITHKNIPLLSFSSLPPTPAQGITYYAPEKGNGCKRMNGGFH